MREHEDPRLNQDGGSAELVALPKESISGGMNLIDGRAPELDIISLAEPLACCLNGQELTAVCEGDVVLIIGGGPIGCLHAVLAELRGAEKIIVAEKLETGSVKSRDIPLVEYWMSFNRCRKPSSRRPTEKVQT